MVANFSFFLYTIFQADLLAELSCRFHNSYSDIALILMTIGRGGAKGVKGGQFPPSSLKKILEIGIL